MGSRIRKNPKKVFECFLEVVAPSADRPDPWILQIFPETFHAKEILKSVGQFAYPCEIISNTVQHFSFVLTNIDSKWTYGFCRHAPKAETCFCILSYLPWHETFYKLLDRIAEIAHRREDSNLTNFLEAVYSSHLPNPGSRLHISYNSGKNVCDVHCPDHLKLPNFPDDRNLMEYYSAIDVNNMVLIFASMLNERRVLITSSRLSRLSACVQAASALIYPMHWQHIFIPVLPVHLTDYQSAPMPFLIGVPTAVFERASRSELGEVVIVYADSNRIDTPFDDLQSLPLDIVANLKRRLKSSDSLRGDGIARAFLFALVQLIGGYRDALKFNGSEVVTFCRDTFIQTRPPNMQPYLERMLHLQIFQQFIEERLEMLNTGKGLNDIFEEEVSLYADKGGAKFKMQYKEWMGNFKKEGGALLRTVKSKANPAVRHAYKHVRDKSKKAYKEVRSIFQDNVVKDSKYSPTYTENIPQPHSAPSSPTLARPSSIHSTKLSRNMSSQRSVASYVRQREGPARRTVNGRLENAKTSVQYSPLRVGISPTENSTVQKGKERSPSPDLTLQRLNMDLMGDLQDVIFRKCSLTESNGINSPVDGSPTSSVEVTASAPPVNRALKPQLSPEISTGLHSDVRFPILTHPLPPPRSKRQCTLNAKDPLQSEAVHQLSKKEDAPLIRLDSDDSDIIFDPLVAKDEDENYAVKSANSCQFQSPNEKISTSPQHIVPLQALVIPPPSPSSAGLNNPVYYQVRPPAAFQQPVRSPHPASVVNGNSLFPYLGNGIPQLATNQTYGNSLLTPVVYPPTTAFGTVFATSPVPSPASFTHRNCVRSEMPNTLVSSPASPNTFLNNNHRASDLVSQGVSPLSPHFNFNQSVSPTMLPSQRKSATQFTTTPQISYLHSSYQHGMTPAINVVERTNLSEGLNHLDPGRIPLRHQENSIVPENRQQWQTFE